MKKTEKRKSRGSCHLRRRERSPGRAQSVPNSVAASSCPTSSKSKGVRWVGVWMAIGSQGSYREDGSIFSSKCTAKGQEATDNRCSQRSSMDTRRVPHGAGAKTMNKAEERHCRALHQGNLFQVPPLLKLYIQFMQVSPKDNCSLCLWLEKLFRNDNQNWASPQEEHLLLSDSRRWECTQAEHVLLAQSWSDSSPISCISKDAFKIQMDPWILRFTPCLKEHNTKSLILFLSVLSDHKKGLLVSKKCRSALGLRILFSLLHWVSVSEAGYGCQRETCGGTQPDGMCPGCFPRSRALCRCCATLTWYRPGLRSSSSVPGRAEAAGSS